MALSRTEGSHKDGGLGGSDSVSGPNLRKINASNI